MKVDGDGNLVLPAPLRKSILPANLGLFLTELGLTAQEGVFHQGWDPTLNGGAGGFNGAAGLMVQDDTQTQAVDNVDFFVNPNNPQGRVSRVGLKVAPTIRGLTLGAGGALPIHDASDPQGKWFISAWKEGDPSVNLSGWVYGHAADPLVDKIDESADPPLLSFDTSGTEIQLRNNDVASAQFSYTVERVG